MDRFQNTRQPDWDWWSRLWPAPSERLRELGVGEGETLLEVGSGNGYFALPAARIVAPAPVYAVDLDRALLDELDSLASLQGLDNVRTVEGDARNLDELLGEQVDLCLLANTLHGIESPGPVVRGIAAALGPGGRLLVINWADREKSETTVAGEARGPPTELRLSAADTIERICEHGPFEHVRTVELAPYHYGVEFEKLDR